MWSSLVETQLGCISSWI